MGTPYPKPEPRAKKQPQPLKRTPIKVKPEVDSEAGKVKLKVVKPIRKFTPERHRLENEKHRMYAREAETRQPYCKGCGTTQNLSHSHRISQNDRTLIADARNVDYYCQDNCHPNYENGYLWRLDNGAEVLEYLQEKSHYRYTAKVFQMKDRIYENSLLLEDMPEWVQLHINSITK